MAATACGAIVVKCSLTIHSRCCTLSVTSVYAKPSRRVKLGINGLSPPRCQKPMLVLYAATFTI